MRLLHLWSLPALLLLTGLGWANQEPPKPEDFAWGVDLQTRQSKALCRLPLPRVVYEGVTRADLADVAVFNGQGQLVPHDLSMQPMVAQPMVAPRNLEHDFDSIPSNAAGSSGGYVCMNSATDITSYILCYKLSR